MSREKDLLEREYKWEPIITDRTNPDNPDSHAERRHPSRQTTRKTEKKKTPVIHKNN